MIQKYLHMKKIWQNIKLMNPGSRYMYYSFSFSTYFNIFKWKVLRETLPSQPHIPTTTLKLLCPTFLLYFPAKNISEDSSLLSVSTSLFSHENRFSPQCTKLAPDEVNKIHIVKSKVPLNSHLMNSSTVSDPVDQFFLERIFLAFSGTLFPEVSCCLTGHSL